MNIVNEDKEKLQVEALNTWITSKHKGTIVVGTGVGKTKIGLMALKECYNASSDKENFSALIIVPTTNLRDNEWIQEINKWYPELLSLVEIECIQTAYKKIYNVDLLIMDEIHTTLSPEYKKVYNSTYKAIIGLTATEPHIEEYGEILNGLCPIVFKLSLDEAVALHLISNFNVYNIPVSFTRVERAKYEAYTKIFQSALYKLSALGDPFKIAQIHLKNKSSSYQAVAQKFWRGMSIRRWVCYRAERKLDICVELIQNIPRKKWIVFAQHTDFADNLALKLRELGIFAVSYHSKQKGKYKKEILEAARSPLCSVICSAQALNVGYNLPDIDGAICIGSTGTELTFTQQLGQIGLYLFNSGKPKFILNMAIPSIFR